MSVLKFRPRVHTRVRVWVSVCVFVLTRVGLKKTRFSATLNDNKHKRTKTERKKDRDHGERQSQPKNGPTICT